MKTSREWKWGVWSREDDAWFQELQRRHEQLHDRDCIPPNARIPKRLHQIWLGPREIPLRMSAWSATWRAHHPDWDYKLWRDDDVETLALTNARAFQDATNYGEKSDILRYEILAQLGGVYVDMDMECLQPLDDLVVRYSFAVGVSNTACVEINNAVVAACPHHAIVLRLIDKIHRQPRRDLDASLLARIALMGGTDAAPLLSASSPMSTIERTGPGVMTRTFMEAIGWTSTATGVAHEGFLSTEDQALVVALPTHVLYPLANDASDDEKLHPRAFPRDARAVHYWARTWQVK